MAKSKKSEDSILDDILESTGGQTLRNAGQVPYYVDTGNLAINFACSGRFISGGFPGGRIIEAFGPEASGKSFLGYCFLGAIQKGWNRHPPRLRAVERQRVRGALRPRQPRQTHRLQPRHPPAGGEADHLCGEGREGEVPDKPIGIVWDSIGVNPTEREFSEVELPDNPTKAQLDAVGHERPGERAKFANKILRSLNPFLNDNDATLYVINQVRKKIGVIYGNDETTSGGGEALKFYASLRFRTGAPKSFQDKDTKLSLGVNMTIANKKNRHFTPGIKVENVPLFFDSGINPLGGLLDALIMANRVEPAKGAGKYRILSPWNGGDEEAVFQQAKSAPFDSEVLMKYPAIVDAADEGEVQEYLKEWSDAIALTTSESVEEIDSGNPLGIGNED